MAVKQKETAEKVAEGESLRFAEMQEKGRLQEILKQLQVHNQEVQDEIKSLQSKDEALHAFIAQKEAKMNTRASIQTKRKELFERKVQKEQAIVEAKRRIEQKKKLMSDNEKKAEAVDKEKQQNDEAIPKALRSKSELVDILKEKAAIKNVLEQVLKPSDRFQLNKEVSRLEELRLRSETRKKDLESKQAALREKADSVKKRKEESTIDVQNLRKVAEETAAVLKSEQERFKRLMARYAQRDKAFRKLQILRLGAKHLDECKATQLMLRSQLVEN